MAKDALVRNKLRSFLSVLGITIGIYCIIVVYAMVHSLEKNLNDSFTSLGKDILFVQKWPWDEFGGNYPWWKYLGRPQTRPEEAVFLEENLPKEFSKAVAFSFRDNVKVEFKSISLSNVSMTAISYGYNEVQKVNIEKGRYFTLQETFGANVTIIGATIAEKLFGEQNPVGRQIRIKNHPCTIVGVFVKEGQSLIGASADEAVYLPVKFAMGMVNYREGEKNCQVLIKANEGVSLDDMTFEISQLMRRYRRIKPSADANFAVNRMSMITSAISSLFGIVKLIGIIIGGFSMLVGCFGVANIMFVSVKERTQEIGIQKALGARRNFILVQFLFESIMLCLIGGLVGMCLVWLTFVGGNYILSHQMNSALVLYLGNGDIWLGIGVSVIVGLAAGFIPASKGSRLNPVDAIRSK